MKSQIFPLFLLSVLILTACNQQQEAVHYEEITVERLNIVGEDGTKRIVLSNNEQMPPPVLGGEEFERSVSPSGIVFYDSEGNERGGVGVSSQPEGEQVAFLFDYQNSEAIGFSKVESADDEYYKAGLQVYDRQPLDTNIREVGSLGTRRIEVTNDNGVANISLFDSEGNPRIRLSVNEEDEPRIEILDKEGNAENVWPDN